MDWTYFTEFDFEVIWKFFPALFAKRLRVLNDANNFVKPVGLAYAVRPEKLHMLHFLNTFIQDFVRNGDHITLRDKWFDILAKRN